MSYPFSIGGQFGAEKVLSTSQTNRRLGTRMATPDGRVFYYSKRGTGAVTAGKLLQQAVVTSGHTKDIVVASAAAVGDRSITLTNNTTAITADMYKDGYAFVNDAAGEGQTWVIKSHETAGTTDDFTVTFHDNDKVMTALTTSSEVGLRKNPWDGTIIFPTTATGIPAGVTPVDTAADEFFWSQTWGPASVLTAGTVVVGNIVVPITTAGAVGPAGTDTLLPRIGYVMSVSATTEYSLIYLTISQ